MTLDQSFVTCPLAHRGLHDKTGTCPENSRAAAQVAINQGFGIECDVQLSRDGVAMVFHDYDLRRLTEETGSIQGKSAQDLAKMTLLGGTETIPKLVDFLALVAGRVPLLIEIKDQHGAMGQTDRRLETAVAKALADYAGPVAVMSFNPHSVIAMADLAPSVPRGLTTSAYLQKDWGPLPSDVRENLRAIPDYDRAKCCFISHEAKDLARARVMGLKAQGAKILCWTIRSAEAEAEARAIADNVTFESYLPKLPN